MTTKIKPSRKQCHGWI